MDVDVDVLGRKLEEQRQHRVAVAREHVGIGAAHRADQQPVLHRTAVDEQVLVVGDAAVVGRQAGNAREARRPAFHVEHDRVAGQLAGDQQGDASREPFPALHVEDRPSAMF